MCADIGSAETCARECRALEEAAREYPRAIKRLLVLNADPLSSKIPDDVIVQPTYQWLLDDERGD